MKKYLVLCGILFSVFSYGQTYTINHSLNVSAGNGSYGDGCRNHIRVILYYKINGYEKSIDLYGEIDLNSGRASSMGSLNVTGTGFEITRIVTKASRNWKRDFGGCGGNGSFDNSERTTTINSSCSVYKSGIARWWNASLSLNITPELTISFPGGANSAILCETEGLQINTTSHGASNPFMPKSEYYRWEYMDVLNPIQVYTIEFDRLLKDLENAQLDYNNCWTKCDYYEGIYREALEAVFSYSGPVYMDTYEYKPIVGLEGEPNPNITLRDIYPNDSDYVKAINKEIAIRLTNACGDETGLTSITFLPEPPRLREAPKIKQPSCSYSIDGGFEVFLDRGIYDYEVLNINLREIASGSNNSPLPNQRTPEQLAMGRNAYLNLVNKTYEIVTNNNNGITNTNPKYNPSLKSYTWNGDIPEGKYAIVISGYIKDDKDRLQPVCEQSYYFFEIVAPDRVNFSANLAQNELCYNANNGEIEISASGGSGHYEYILNGNDWSSVKTFTAAQSPIVVAGLAPGTYNVQVRDSKGCYDLDELNSPKKINEVIITGMQQLTHTEGHIIHPGAPGKTDGSLIVSSITGGTPSHGNNGDYMDYVVLLHNSSTDTKAGKGYVKGFQIDGLPAGNHKIRYTDANNCSVTLDLPEIKDPAPITYTLTKVSPSCSDSEDGKLTVSEIKGGYPSYNVAWTRNGIPVLGNALSITGGDTSYTISITDERSGEVVASNIQFTNVPAPLTFTTSIENISCYGGTATVTFNPSGGTSPYQYGVKSGSVVTWYDTNVVNLPASSGPGYRFQIRELNSTGCDSEISGYYQITEPSEITINNKTVVSNDIFKDNQGSITIEVSGGLSPYHVIWKKTEDSSFSDYGLKISNLTAGNYIPTITDATGACVIVGDAIYVDEPEQLRIAIDASTSNILCNGGTGSLISEATGGSENYTYTWFKDGSKLFGEHLAILNNVSAGNYSVQVNDGYTSSSASVSFVEPETLELTALGTDVSCYEGADGKIQLIAKGGTRPYFFSIDNKQTYLSENALTNFVLEGVSVGSYNVWIKDANGCEISTAESVVIGQPNEIIISEAALENVTTLGGNDGNIDISIIGGVGSYHIAWSSSEDISFASNNEDIAELYYGTYTVLVTDDNNCTAERSFTILEPLPMEVAITLEHPVWCHEAKTGMLLAKVTGGYPLDASPEDFEYQWFRIDNGVEVSLNTDLTLESLSNLAAGIYKVVANDVKGANTESTFEITQPDDLVVALERLPIPVLCHGEATGAISITVTGGPKDPSTGQFLPYSYEWTKEEDSDFYADDEDLTGLTVGTYNLLVTDANSCTVSLEKIRVEEPEAPLQISNVVFEDLKGYKTENGSISLMVQGGTPPYQYIWSNTEDFDFTATTKDINGLTKGIYQLVVTDANGCKVSLEQQLIEPEELIIAITPLTNSESIQCHGENTVFPLRTKTTGGFGNYTYEWHGQNDYTSTSETTTPVPAGTYTVVVTDENGNTDSDTYTVEEPDVLGITEQVTHLLCNNDRNGNIDVTVTGGVAPYTYLWSSGQRTEDLLDLRAGKYTLTVKDVNACTLSKTIEIKQPQALFANIDRSYPSDSNTNDGVISVTTQGGTPPFKYEWYIMNGSLLPEKSNVLSGTDAGKYALKVTDANNCSLEIDDIDLFEPPVLEVFIEQVSVISCFGNANTGSLTTIVQGGVPFNANKQYTYTWFDAITDQPLGTDASLLNYIGAGTYYVTVTDAVGTKTTSSSFELKEPDELQLNLNADFVNCGDQEDWAIFSKVQGGTAPYEYKWNTNEKTENLKHKLPGTYILEVTDIRGCYISKQITLNAPQPLAVTYTVKDPICYGGCDGNILISPSGGTPPYQYLWNTSATEQNLEGVCAGTYSVIISDAKSCQINQTVIIENPEQLIIDLGEDITLCKDQSFVLDATIADSNAAYYWTSENGFKATTALIEVNETGIYQVMVTDSKGCTAEGSIFVEATTAEIYTDFITNSQVFAGEEFLLFDISDPIPDALLWRFPSEANIKYQDIDYAEISFDTPGEYEVTIHARFGLCEELRTKKILVIERAFAEGDTSLAKDEDKLQFIIYPNPATDGKFAVEVGLPKVEPISIKIYGIANNVLLETRKGIEKDFYKFWFDLNKLPSGLYFVLLETGSGNQQVRKLIIE